MPTEISVDPKLGGDEVENDSPILLVPSPVLNISRPVLDTLQKMTNSELVNVASPITKLIGLDMGNIWKYWKVSTRLEGFPGISWLNDDPKMIWGLP